MGLEEKKLLKKKGKASGDLKQLYDCCAELADYYYGKKKYEEALLQYKEAEEIAISLNNAINVAIINRMIGEIYCDMGQYEKAVQHQKIHLEISKKEGNLVEEQRALATLGRTYFEKGESFECSDGSERKKWLGLARNYHVKSLEICERLPFSVGLRIISEMKVRIYRNLCLTLEPLGEISQASLYITEAIDLCKRKELWDDLYYCYVLRGSLLFRQRDTRGSLDAYAEALALAGRLKNPAYSCDILSLKCDVLVEISDFVGAKHALVRAYKLKNSDSGKRFEIERKLRIVYVMCETEKKLLNVEEKDFENRRKLNETMGDCCAALERFKKAVVYYKKMLECTEASGLCGKELSPAFVSLAQTYKDDKDYDAALVYYGRDLEVTTDAVEACKTILNMGEMMELRGDGKHRILEEYEKARKFAAEAGDWKLRAIVLKKMIGIQRELGMSELAETNRKILDEISSGNESPELESEDEEEVMNKIGVDLDLDNISDMDGDEDEEGRCRKKRKPVSGKLNAKGETPLHVACIQGNLQLVKTLVQQGHPVNVEDGAGWSPLHEACNYGRTDIVEALIEAGANIDNRGGKLCEGLTPLHDAAANGNLDVVDFLLDKGASPLVRTDKGETVLDCLLAWRDRAVAETGREMDEMTSAQFEETAKRLSGALKKAGYDPEKRNFCKKRMERDGKSGKYGGNDGRGDGEWRCRNAVSLSDGGNDGRGDGEWRCRNTVSLSDARGRDKAGNSLATAAQDYQTTMEALRRGNKREVVRIREPYPVKAKTAFLTEDEVGDDWLEDDLRLSGLKRPVKRVCKDEGRTCDGNNGQKARKDGKSGAFKDEQAGLNGGQRCRLRRASGESVVFDTDEISAESTQVLRQPDLFDDDDDGAMKISPRRDTEDDWLENFHVDSMSTSSPKVRKPSYDKFQKSSSYFETKEMRRKRPIQDDFFTSFIVPVVGSESSTTQPPPPPKAASILRSIKVRVEGKLFLIPIPGGGGEEKNIGWLTSEATRRYHNLQGVSPVLNLMTPDGALLDANDPLSILSDQNEIHGAVLSWNLPPLKDLYKEACSSLKIAGDKFVESQLDVCEGNFRLEISHAYVAEDKLLPAFKALSHYHTLREITLSAVYLNDKSFRILADCLKNLRHLRSLDVSVNCISAEGIEYLAKFALNRNLECLDLSFNPICYEDANDLLKLLRELPFLKELSLKEIGLKGDFFYSAHVLHLDFLESLDVSCNDLGREGVTFFLSALDSSKVRNLDFSRVGGSEVCRECCLFFERGHVDSLINLEMAGLNLDDADVEELVRSLKGAEKLSYLNLSCNTDTGGVECCRYLSQLKSLKNVRLDTCDFSGVHF